MAGDVINAPITIVYNTIDGALALPGTGSSDPNVKDPTRDFGAVLNGSTNVTAKYLQAMTAAKKAAISGFTYGLGGKVRQQVGVALCDPLDDWSRWVSLDGAGALGSAVIRASYTSLGGVPGQDAMITFAQDGSGQSGIIGQNKIHNIALDGRRSTIEGVTDPLRGHTRHGIELPDPTDGTDRVFSSEDLLVCNCAGDGIHIENNDQVRGGNWKLTGNRRGFYFSKVKDGKIDEIGSGQNGPRLKDGNNYVVNDQIDTDAEFEAANVFADCASLKVGRVDYWTGPNSGAIPLVLWKSCAKMVIDEGELEGMAVISGDNDNNNSKSYRQVLANSFALINSKVSVDMDAAYRAAGITPDVLTGAGYVAHVKIVDATGCKMLGHTLGYKLGQPADGDGNRLVSIQATPPLGYWFGTKVASSDSHYSDYLKACGDLDITGASLTWWEGKDSPGGLRTRSVYAFKEHISNMPHHLRGLRLGRITLRQVGTQMEDEIALDGAQYTTQYDKGLLYLCLDPNWASGNWASMRKLTDEDSVGLGYKTFNVWNWSAEATRLSTLLGVTVAFYMVYKQ